MFRLRFATVAVAAGLGLVSGCLCLSEYPLFGRFRAHPAADCYGVGAVPDSEGPIVEDSAINGVGPGSPGVAPMPRLDRQNSVPPLASPPRNVPQPQAQPAPYVPPQ